VTLSLETPELADLFDLTGRTAVVTGAAMGIGCAIAARLAAAGAAVVIADLDASAAAATAKEFEDREFNVLAVGVDVADERDVRAIFDTAIAWRGKVDILVNNAGIFPTVPVLDMTVEDFDRVQAVNLRGAFLCAREAGRRMRKQGTGGVIINITSIDALHPSSVGLAHYDASKHGLWGFTKNLALELAPFGIRVNALAPGAVATPGASAASPHSDIDPQEVIAAFVARIPMGRIGQPDDIARMALVLASDVSSYMTGAQVVVDGGVLLS
jgi:2-deoxy-D-gluconate 3-dehydrogenase